MHEHGMTVYTLIGIPYFIASICLLQKKKEKKRRKKEEEENS
jgi:hypothetical protein